MSATERTTSNVNVISIKPIISPLEIRKRIPYSSAAKDTVASSRTVIRAILERQDPRIFVILGPCSIHDPKSALEYARLLRELANDVKDTMFLVMRAYFEKPRTTVGWKGLINDPNLDNTFNINKGLTLARALLTDITKMGVPVATEALEPISPQYIADLISWTAIGARTTESQTHRELASGLSSPVGFKNNTDGNIEVAINAIKSAMSPHHFLGIDDHGLTSIVATKGNPHGHLILRGGKGGPNFDRDSVAKATAQLRAALITERMVIDCSHDNSQKDYRNQPKVFNDCIEQIAQGNHNIVGLMLESHIVEGNQSLGADLRYGVSITDGCLGFEETTTLLHDAHKRLLSTHR